MKQRLTSIITMVCALFIHCSLLSAQNNEEMKRTINSIKKDNSYIYAETTAETPEASQKLAEEILMKNVKEWAMSQRKLKKADHLIIKNTKNAMESMALPRGNMFRCFVYVSKKNIEGADNAMTTANEGKADANAPAATPSPATPDIVTKVMACKNFNELKAWMTKAKIDKAIENYDAFENIDNHDPYYMAIYNRQYQVVAVLTPGPDRTNVATGQPDAVKNYSGCGAICFRLP